MDLHGQVSDPSEFKHRLTEFFEDFFLKTVEVLCDAGGITLERHFNPLLSFVRQSTATKVIDVLAWYGSDEMDGPRAQLFSKSVW